MYTGDVSVEDVCREMEHVLSTQKQDLRFLRTEIFSRYTDSDLGGSGWSTDGQVLETRGVDPSRRITGGHSVAGKGLYSDDAAQNDNGWY